MWSPSKQDPFSSVSENEYQRIIQGDTVSKEEFMALLEEKQLEHLEARGREIVRIISKRINIKIPDSAWEPESETSIILYGHRATYTHDMFYSNTQPRVYGWTDVQERRAFGRTKTVRKRQYYTIDSPADLLRALSLDSEK